MINYEIINKYIINFIQNKNILLINHSIGGKARYNIIKECTCIFSTNDRYAIRLWMDLNGIKIGTKAYIFTKKMIKNDKNSCLIELKEN